MAEKNSELSRSAVLAVVNLYAIATTAKTYHWQSFGVCFEADHSLFDRIFEDLYDIDFIDTIAEGSAMVSSSENLEILNHVQQFIADQEGQKFTPEQLRDPETLTLMFREIKRMLDQWTSSPSVLKLREVPSMAAVFDDMLRKAFVLTGLVDARLRGAPFSEQASKVMSRLIKMS